MAGDRSISAAGGRVSAPFEILTCEVDRYRVGIALSAVLEVVRAVWVWPLPGAPAVVDGVVDLRGSIVPVLAMRRRFGAPDREVRPSESFVVVRAGDRTVALRVDRVGWIVGVDPAAGSELFSESEPCSGLVRLPDDLFVVVDLQRFLSQPEGHVLDRALADHEASAGAGR